MKSLDRVLCKIACLSIVFIAMTASVSAFGGDTFFYHDGSSSQSLSTKSILIDTRKTESCQLKTLAGAICLSPEQLSHPDGQLASMRDVNWLFGSLGMDEKATALVFGDSIDDNHFVASLIYVAGQASVGIWTTDVQQLIQRHETDGGVVQGLLRRHFYQATLRDKLLLLDSDVQQFFKTASTTRLKTPESEPAQIYQREDGVEIVVAATTREALIAFGKRQAANVLAQPDRIRVHITGLGERNVAQLGASQSSKSRKFFSIVAVVASLLLTVYAVRRSVGWLNRLSI